MKQKIEAIDLFCGIGGLTYGLREAGIDVKVGLDLDSSCKYAYEKNNNAKFIKADISQYDITQLKSFYTNNAVKVLVGCAPCQPFSTHSHKVQSKEKDKRWNLIDYFAQAVGELEPEIISMENVRGLTKTVIFKKFLKTLENLGYYLNYSIVFCPDYGIPQNRYRLVLIGAKNKPIDLPQKTHSKDQYKTVQDAIKNLPGLHSGSISLNDPVHRAKGLIPINLERIKQSKPNGTWKNWDKRLLPNCYKKESGQTYISVYGRMSWDKPSPTITTQFFNYGSGRFGHPEQDRALSIREGALLQTFPENYDFGEHISLSQIGRHIGNAVPPQLGFVIGKAISEHLKGDL